MTSKRRLPEVVDDLVIKAHRLEWFGLIETVARRPPGEALLVTPEGLVLPEGCVSVISRQAYSSGVIGVVWKARLGTRSGRVVQTRTLGNYRAHDGRVLTGFRRTRSGKAREGKVVQLACGRQVVVRVDEQGLPMPVPPEWYLGRAMA